MATTLYRPVGLDELALIWDSGCLQRCRPRSDWRGGRILRRIVRWPCAREVQSEGQECRAVYGLSSQVGL